MLHIHIYIKNFGEHHNASPVKHNNNKNEQTYILRKQDFKWYLTDKMLLINCWQLNCHLNYHGCWPYAFAQESFRSKDTVEMWEWQPGVPPRAHLRRKNRRICTKGFIRQPCARMHVHTHTYTPIFLSTAANRWGAGLCQSMIQNEVNGH
jgi:hypothetical protein